MSDTQQTSRTINKVKQSKVRLLNIKRWFYRFSAYYVFLFLFATVSAGFWSGLVYGEYNYYRFFVPAETLLDYITASLVLLVGWVFIFGVWGVFAIALTDACLTLKDYSKRKVHSGVVTELLPAQYPIYVEEEGEKVYLLNDRLSPIIGLTYKARLFIFTVGDVEFLLKDTNPSFKVGDTVVVEYLNDKMHEAVLPNGDLRGSLREVTTVYTITPEGVNVNTQGTL